MSLYNMIFGMNQHADFILATLGLTRGDVGRFRDAYVSEGNIAVYTRNGGGNRYDYQGTLDALAAHPQYIRDEDDDFDCTYCTIYFSFPDQWKDELSALESGTFNPSERWYEKIDGIKNGELTPAMKAFGERLMKQLADGKGGIIEV